MIAFMKPAPILFAKSILTACMAVTWRKVGWRSGAFICLCGVGLTGCTLQTQDQTLKTPAQSVSGSATPSARATLRPRIRPVGLRRAAGATRPDTSDVVAIAPATSAGGLGATIASLGDATKPGFWLRTPLVKTPTAGRISYAATGRSVDVDLIPIDGPTTAGSRISIHAMMALGAGLTDLPEIQVSHR